jgi:hypothetical protein
MQAYKETTIWADGSKCNHTYLLDGDQMWAYIPAGRAEAQYFVKPIRISRSGRKFETLAKSPFKTVTSEPITTVIKVAGSKGQVYSVDTEAKTCTCSGYTFRGTCKHTKDL